MKEIIIAVIIAFISALLGGSGLVGFTVYYIKRYIDKKLTESEKQIDEIRQYRLQKAKCDEKIQHTQGRLFFWLYKAVETGSHNGDLKNAFTELQEAEDEKKELEREIIAMYEQKRQG